MSKVQHTDLFGDCRETPAERRRRQGRERFAERYRTDPEFREKVKARNRAAYQNDPAVRERARLYGQTHRSKNPLVRKRAQEKAKQRYHTDPEYREQYLARRRGKPRFKSQEERDAYNAKKRELRKTDPKMRQRVYESSVRWHTKNRIIALARRCVSRAKRIGVPADVAWLMTLGRSRPEQCPCCNERLDYSFGLENRDRRKPNWRVPSMDRIAPSRGYVKGNVEIVCRRCNALKRDGTIQEFEQIITYMRSRLGRVDS